MTVHAGPVPVTRVRSGRAAEPDRSARVTVEIDLAGGGAPGVASALCAEISDLLAEHARSGDTSVSASVSLGFGDAATRPAASAAPPASPAFPGDDGAALRIVAGRRIAVQDGVEVPLTRREFDLLAFLARNPRQVFSRSQLIDAVWGARYRDSERTIDVHVRRIRVKLSPTGPRIVTVRGVGYRLDHPERVAVVPGVE